VQIGLKVGWLALAALTSVLGCQRCGSCGSADGTASSGVVPSASEEASATPPGSASAPEGDVPEIRDTGTGRATAALRAVLQAYGIAFEATAIEKECKVDEDGASIDDLEDVAVHYGLDALQVIVPAEHVLLPEAKLLPAIVVADGPEETEQFVVAWRLDGDRVRVMSPIEGRTWATRSDLKKSLHVHEMAVPADDFRAAMGTPSFRDALRTRAEALGVERSQALALVDRAAADPGWRGLGALDAAIRQMEADPPKAADGAPARLSASFGCAFERRCDGVEEIPAALWSVQIAPKGPEGEEQVQVRGVVMLAIAGRRDP
jgi:hypothetical protein